MGPSEKSFSQVKAILGKLDRNIDQLRERRSTKPMSPASEPTRPEPMPNTRIPAPAPKAPEAPARPGSPYGRATPIPPSSMN